MLAFDMVFELSFLKKSFWTQLTRMLFKFLVNNFDMRVERRVLRESFPTLTGVSFLLSQVLKSLVCS